MRDLRRGMPEKKYMRQLDFGEDLSWEYLCFVREHPVRWNVPTDILYGSKDNLTSIDIMTAFAQAHHASLTILDGGDHWFHTDAQIQFLDHWIRDKSDYQATGIGSQLMVKVLKLLKRKGFERASLAVHKANYEVKMYRNVGFKTVDENAEEFIVVCELYFGISRKRR